MVRGSWSDHPDGVWQDVASTASVDDMRIIALHRARVGLAGAALLLVLAGCGDDDGDGDTAVGAGSGVTAEDLDGRTFTSTDVTGRDLVTGSEITISFTDGTIGVEAGCNSMSGSYAIDDGELEVGTLAQTMMACDDDLMDQDEWLAAFLEDDPDVALDGDTLTLRDDGVTITATEA